MDCMEVRDRLCEIGFQIDSLIGLVCTANADELISRQDVVNTLRLVKGRVEKIEQEFDSSHWDQERQ